LIKYLFKNDRVGKAESHKPNLQQFGH